MSTFISRLADLKSSQDETGSKVYSKRVQFVVQDVQDLRANGWVGKLRREKATTKAEVRLEAQRQDHSRLGGVALNNAISGLKPEYLLRRGGKETPTSTPKAGKDTATPKAGKESRTFSPTSASKDPRCPTWSKDYVKKVFYYYLEDRVAAGLDNDWCAAKPSRQEAAQGAEWLLETAASTPKHSSAVAEALSHLVRCGTLPVEHLVDVLGPWLRKLDDLKLDCPGVEGFAKELISRVLLPEAGTKETAVLRALPTGESASTLTLLLGALQSAKRRCGAAALKPLLEASGPVTNAVARAKGCQTAVAAALLRKEGLC